MATTSDVQPYRTPTTCELLREILELRTLNLKLDGREVVAIPDDRIVKSKLETSLLGFVEGRPAEGPAWDRDNGKGESVLIGN
jgi:hypothetical protein